MSAPVVVFFDAFPHLLVGAQVVTLRLAAERARRQLPVEIWVAAEGPYAEQARRLGLPVTVLPTPSALRRHGARLGRFRRVVALLWLPLFWMRAARRLSPGSVLHTNDERGLVMMGPAAVMRRSPVVWHLHTRPSAIGLRVGVRGAACTVAVSVGARDQLPAGIRRHVVVIPNPMPEHPAFDADPADEGSGDRDADLVLSVGRLHPMKGHDVLVRAMVGIRSRVPTARLVVAGPVSAGFEGWADGLDAAVDELGLRDAVELVGHRADLGRWYRRAAVLVVPSREEQAPLVIGEAMQAGVPVVASDVGAVADLVQDGVNGLLVPSEDEVALGDAVARVLTDGRLREQLVAGGRRSAERLPGPEAVGQEWSALYDRILRRRAR